jgi:predicted HNH restriction endonuclease
MSKGRAPDVHHIKAIGSFATTEEANHLGNLVCLCHSCHMYVEWHGMDFTP